MYSEPNYVLYHAASRSLGNANKANLFGLYSGLSALNSEDVIRVEVLSTTRESYIIPTETATILGYRIDNYSPYYTPLPPMKAGTASLLGIHSPGASASNSTIYFAIFRRLPY